MKTENTKKIGFNALDIVVILVIFALLVTVLVRSGMIKKLTFSGSEFTVTCCLEKTQGLQLDSLKDAAVYSEDDRKFGMVKAVRYLIDGEGNTYAEVDIAATLMKKDGRFITDQGASVVKGTELALHTQLIFLDIVVNGVN